MHIAISQRRRIGIAIALSTATVLLASTPGRAANLPYCTVGENIVECFYASLWACEAAGRNTGRACTVNPDFGYSSAFASADMPMSATPVGQYDRTQMAAAGSEDIRQKCIAQAQARYPDNGLGTATVMTQRTAVYADCARRNGIRP